MKLHSFVLKETRGNNLLNRVYIAEVDMETGHLFWKKKERKEIQRKYAGAWFFTDTGEYVPGFKAEELARAWEASTGQKC